MLKNRDFTLAETHRYQMFGKIHDESTIPFGNRPAIILLHGRAGDETLMWVFSKVIQDLDPIVVAPRAIVPDSIGGYSWWQVDQKKEEIKSNSPKTTSFENLKPAIKLIQFLVEDLPTSHGVDPRKIFVIGFSQGGALAITSALMNPKLFTGVGMVASFVPEAIQSYFDNADMSELDVFMSHGKKDQIIPIEKAERSAEFLQKINCKLQYSVDEVAHKISSSGLKSFKEWINRIGQSLEI